MRHHAHGDEHDHEIEENGKVGQDAEFLECADLAEAKTTEGPDKTADGIAEFELGDLGKGLAVADDNVTNAQEQLETLQEVDDIARDPAINTESEIGVVLAGIFVGIKTHEASPQEPTGISSHDAKYSEESDTGTPSQGSHGKSNTKRTKDISGNEIEAGGT